MGITKQRGLILGATAFVLNTITVTGAGLLRLSASQASFEESPKEVIDEAKELARQLESFNQ
jgi:carboxyl-terminal processing protease